MLKKEFNYKLSVLLCSLSFLYLSYINVASGLNSQIDNESTIGYGLNIGYFVFISSYVILLLCNSIRETLWPLSILGAYIAFLFLTEVSSAGDVIRVVGLLLWVLCYYFGNRISSCSSSIKNYFVYLLFLSTTVLSFYFLYFYYVKGFLQYQTTTDTAFFLIVYLPFVLMFKKRKTIKLFVLLLFVVVAVLSLKRSIVLGLLVFFVSYFVSSAKGNVLKKWYFWLMLPLVIAVVAYLYGTVGEILGARFNDSVETGGNGRTDIYVNIWHHFTSSSFLEQLFGHGLMSVRQINNGILAHNDFLQLLYDGGLMAATLYIFMWFALFSVAIKNWRLRKQIGNYYAVYVATIMLYLVLSLMNCFIYSYMLISPMMLAVGYQVGEIKNKNCM